MGSGVSNSLSFSVTHLGCVRQNEIPGKPPLQYFLGPSFSSNVCVFLHFSEASYAYIMLSIVQNFKLWLASEISKHISTCFLQSRSAELNILNNFILHTIRILSTSVFKVLS